MKLRAFEQDHTDLLLYRSSRRRKPKPFSGESVDQRCLPSIAKDIDRKT